jgi:hypothetical protein
MALHQEITKLQLHGSVGSFGKETDKERKGCLKDKKTAWGISTQPKER